MITGLSLIRHARAHLRLGLPLIGRLPELFLLGYGHGVERSFVLLQGWALALAWSVLLVPTLALGARWLTRFRPMRPPCSCATCRR